LAASSAHGFDETMTCMRVPIDQSRQDGLSGSIDYAVSLVAGLDFSPGSHVANTISADGDGTILDNPAGRIHGDDNAASDK
jgi:hypothetical protein